MLLAEPLTDEGEIEAVAGTQKIYLLVFRFILSILYLIRMAHINVTSLLTYLLTSLLTYLLMSIAPGRA